MPLQAFHWQPAGAEVRVALRWQIEAPGEQLRNAAGKSRRGAETQAVKTMGRGILADLAVIRVDRID